MLGEEEYFAIEFQRKNSNVKDSNENTAFQCSMDWERAWSHTLRKLPFVTQFLLLAHQYCICGDGITRQKDYQNSTNFYYCFLCYGKLTKHLIMSYTGQKGVTVHLPTSCKTTDFSSATLPTAILLLNLGLPPQAQRGRTSVYNGLGNKNPIREYQKPLRK